MKRYIEIVYDNSGSMDGYIGNKKKCQIAQELFNKEILPLIGLSDDQIVLRLLSNDCSKYHSEATSLPNDKTEMLRIIKSINNGGTTPLIYTIHDAIEECRKTTADKHLIFVLTDGDDTCNTKINEIISQDLIDKYVRFYNVLLVQLAVDSTISKNNLTAITNYIGGYTISLDAHESVTDMRTKIKKALSVSGFSNKMPLEYCFNSLSGNDLTWDEICNTGIAFHQAYFLFEKKLISWKPDVKTEISRLNHAELAFVFGLYFKTGLPEDLVKTMLAQLRKPYHYSHDCIYWDFSSARWKYFVPQNKTYQINNPDAIKDENSKSNTDFEKGNSLDSLEDNYEELYFYDDVYKVISSDKFNTTEPTFELINVTNQSFTSLKPKVLNVGDNVIFRGANEKHNS